jgi:hypothetical protein
MGSHSHGGKSGSVVSQADQLKDMLAALPDMMSIFNGKAGKRYPAQTAFKIENMTPLRRKEAKRIKITYGPYKLRAANVSLRVSSMWLTEKVRTKIGNSFSLDPAGTGYMYTTANDFPKGVTVLDATTGVFDEKMKEISNQDGLYNHHNVFFDLGGGFAPPISCGPSLLDLFNFKVPVNVFMGT